MMRVLFINITLVSAVILAVNAQGYCSANLCKNGLRHIACRNSGRFAARCPNNARLANLRPHRRFILSLHNSKRNLIASGRVRRYRPARRMATMLWNNELAKLAQLNVKQCRMQHDQCRNTRSFGKSGQNLASISYSGAMNSKSVRFLLRNRFMDWWREFRNANQRIISRYPANYNGPPVGHFTALVNERNVRVGCAAARWSQGGANHFLLACNYATTNIVDQPVYRRGRSGSGCRTGRNNGFRNLCSIREFYAGLK